MTPIRRRTPLKIRRRKSTPSKVLGRLRGAFQAQFGLGHGSASTLLGAADLYDKAYELACLIELLRQLRTHLGSCNFVLVGGRNPTFRAKGGPINRGSWPFIEIRRAGAVLAEIWVDIECLALSASRSGKAITGQPYGMAHELDIVVVKPRTSGYPRPDDILLGVEAKHREYNKALLKELLGVRREMTFKSQPTSNPLAWWEPTQTLAADPPSGLVLFCSGSSVSRYQDPADFWGITMIQHLF